MICIKTSTILTELTFSQESYPYSSTLFFNRFFVTSEAFLGSQKYYSAIHKFPSLGVSFVRAQVLFDSEINSFVMEVPIIYKPVN